MCGITGIFHYGDRERPVAPRLLREMTALLAHRGPDGEGIWCEGPVGLGHRRLAILDLSTAAAQPMSDLSGNLVLTFNGEIYNFRELRERLEGHGHHFRSSGDTEVLLAGYSQWGRDVVQHLSGIFAFALWDARRRELFLARDPLGVKPLFYSDDGASFRLASEVKAILRDPTVKREFNHEALDAFFTLGYTPAPATGFREVSQLLPGHAATVSETGFRCWRYWLSPYSPEPSRADFDTALAGFEERLDRAVRSQMVSDVGVGAFLSGGLDSAAIVRSMCRADRGPIRAFSVGLDWETFDELDRARETARRLGVDHAERRVRIDDASVLPALSRHLEEPTADSSVLPVYFLCQHAAEHFKVALAGDGADEILAGYATYVATRLAGYYRRVPGILRRKLIRPLARRIPESDRKYSLRDLSDRFTYGAELGPGTDHCSWRTIFTDDLKRRVYDAGFLRGVEEGRPLERYAEHISSVPASRESLAGLLNADMEFYLPNDMLVKVDRMSMAHGLEVRVPFLDIDLVRYCADLPGEYKLKHGRIRKHILRESLRRTLPPSVLRAPKSGLNIPVDQWMRGMLRDLLFEAVDQVRDELGVFLDVGEVRKMAEEHRHERAQFGHALFVVLMFALWLHNAATCWKPQLPSS